MSRFFTSDWHLNSTLINQYAHRPWITDITNVDNLIRNCDEVASSKSDIVFHVGDFILIGKDRHGRDVDVQYLHNDADSYRSMLKANIVLLSGNHDDGRNCETSAKSMVIDLNHNYRNVYVSHFPSDHQQYRGPVGYGLKKKDVRIVLCGHVHQKWKYFYDRRNHVLNYNVGVDCHDYKPVRDSDITEDLDFILAHHSFTTEWKMTVSDEIEFRKSVKYRIKLGREIRNEERHIKKGLTPEECERRRLEAMKAKGLI